MVNLGENRALQVSQLVTIDGQNYPIASPSEGIASNTALAIVAAKYLGIVESDIRKRVEAWRPSGNRGYLETFREQTFYIEISKQKLKVQLIFGYIFYFIFLACLFFVT